MFVCSLSRGLGAALYFSSLESRPGGFQRRARRAIDGLSLRLADLRAMALATLGQNLQGPGSLIVQFLGDMPAPAMAATVVATWRLRSTSVKADAVLQDMLTPMLKMIQGLLDDLRCVSDRIRQGSNVLEIRHGAGKCARTARSVLDLLHTRFGEAIGPALGFWSGLGPHRAFAKMQAILDRCSADDSPISIQIRVQHLLRLASAVQDADEGQLRRMRKLQSPEYSKKFAIREVRGQRLRGEVDSTMPKPDSKLGAPVPSSDTRVQLIQAVLECRSSAKQQQTKWKPSGGAE